MIKKIGPKIYISKELSKKEIRNKIAQAKQKYAEIALRPPDKMLLAEVKLPKIFYKGKEIDLAKKYKGAQIVAVLIGPVLAIPYLAKKGDDKTLVDFVHFVESPLLLVTDPVDRERIFFAWGKGLKVTDRGIEG
jgi:hypothetical protein